MIFPGRGEIESRYISFIDDVQRSTHIALASGKLAIYGLSVEREYLGFAKTSSVTTHGQRRRLFVSIVKFIEHRCPTTISQLIYALSKILAAAHPASPFRLRDSEKYSTARRLTLRLNPASTALKTSAKLPASSLH